MNKMFIILATIVFLNAQTFAICRDSFAHSQFSKMANEAYKRLDEITAGFIREINNSLESRIKKSEQANEEDSKNLLELEKDLSLAIKEKIFYQKMLNSLQNKYNDISSITK